MGSYSFLALTDMNNTPTSQSLQPETEDGSPQCTNRIAFHVILRTILARLPDRPGLKILDVGGGTAYSFALAERGHFVTVVDTSANYLALAEARASSSTTPVPARILHGDATRIANHPDLADEHGTFDAVLLLQPLSHITSLGLRAAALQDAWDFVCPRGGVLFCGWVSRLAHYRYIALADPAALVRERLAYEGSERDGLYFDSSMEAPRSRHYELPERMPEILRDATGVEDVEMVGAEGSLSGGLDRMVNELQGEEFEAWVEECLGVGTDEHGWRMADHIIGIAIKS